MLDSKGIYRRKVIQYWKEPLVFVLDTDAPFLRHDISRSLPRHGKEKEKKRAFPEADSRYGVTRAYRNANAESQKKVRKNNRDYRCFRHPPTPRKKLNIRRL